MAVLSGMSDVLFLHVYKNLNLPLPSPAFRKQETIEVGLVLPYGLCDSNELVFCRRLSGPMQTAEESLGSVGFRYLCVCWHSNLCGLLQRR